MIDATAPIFVHSHFRSGSTWLFNVFRRAGRCTTFHESLHEAAFGARENPDALLATKGAGAFQEMLRHPPLDAPYWKEVRDAHAAWRGLIAEDIIYADYFGLAAIERTAAYLAAIAEAAPARPLFQECRTACRAAALKERLGGVHLHLWRNPHDQFWSLKANEYFDIAHQVVLNAPARPDAVTILRDKIAFAPCPDASIAAQFEFHRRRRPSPEASYLAWFVLWALAMAQSADYADADINIDLLSQSAAYRRKTLQRLEELGIKGLDFSDCRAPQSVYGAADEAFFLPLEEEARAILLQGAMTAEALAAIEARREAHVPTPRDDAPTLAGGLVRLREVVRRIEGREAAGLKRGRGDEAQFAAMRAALEADIARRDARIAELGAQLEVARRAAAGLGADADAAKARAQSLEAQNQNLIDMLGGAVIEVAAAGDRAARAEARANVLDGQLTLTTGALAGAHARAAAMASSTSWFLTRPLRAVARLLGLYRRRLKT